MVWNYCDIREYLERTRSQNMPPLIITVAITGGMHGKESNVNLPETPDEQAQQTYEAYQAGASIVHIHARDSERGYANPSCDPNVFYAINKKIRTLCPDIIINNTTGGGLFVSREERIRSVEANPEMCTINMGPLVWRGRFKKRLPPLSGRPEDIDVDIVFPPTNYEEVESYAGKMLERVIKPEMEVPNPGQFWLVYDLIDKGLVKPPYVIQFVMGMNTGMLPTSKNLINMLEHAPKDSVINVAGIGPYQLPMTTMAMLLGLNVRVGMEDNVIYSKGVKCKSNAELVERTVRVAKELNREIATPAQAREILGISKVPSRYP